jgi:hypothetical protein
MSVGAASTVLAATAISISSVARHGHIVVAAAAVHIRHALGMPAVSTHGIGWRRSVSRSSIVAAAVTWIVARHDLFNVVLSDDIFRFGLASSLPCAIGCVRE